MALKAVLDNLDGLPADVASEYVEKNGKFELQVEGMKTQGDIDRIQGGLTKERADHKATKDRLSAWGELDPTEVLGKLGRFDELEAAAKGKLDDAGIQKIVDGRLNSVKAPLERQVQQLTAKLGEATTAIEGFQTQNRVRTIGDAVRSAAVKTKVLESAVEDVMMYGERLFEVTEDGQILTRDGVGVTPGVSAEVWLSDMATKKPHWFPGSSGGGAGGGTGSAGGGNNPFSREHWNMTEQGKLLTSNRAKAEQMARAAGTTIGGPMPAPRK
ncbi:MAG TPA: hypothetical protein VN039_05650 [Nitrospira sp.]|nr:hypothetical protein [Nitrospira sp.]